MISARSAAAAATSLSRLVKPMSCSVKLGACFRVRLSASAEPFLPRSLAAWREAMQPPSILTLGAISLVLAACQTPQQAVQQKEDLLAAAGFTLQPANSPARIAAMN